MGGGASRRGPSRRKGGGSRGGPPPRRSPPPAVTGREDEFYERRKKSGAVLTIHLLDGDTVRGSLLEHDRELVTVECPDGTPLVVRKDDIRYIED